MNSRQRLLLIQIDRKLSDFSGLENHDPPMEGWIHSIRVALKMTLKQLGKRIDTSPQNTKELEKREKQGTITLKSLQRVANALGMNFVYAFVPRGVSLQGMIEKRALEIATEIVQRTSTSMKLEDQEVSQESLQLAIQERAKEIIEEMPSFLWD